MDLFIVRHAWAGQPDDPRWPDDDLRPLTDEGKKRFKEMVGVLAGRGFAPEAIATSPLVRCRQTAELIATGVAGRPEIVELAELEPGGRLEGMMVWTERHARQFGRIAWVGHAPDVGRMAAALIGSGREWIRFAKGGAAAIRFHGPPELGQGELRWLVTAKVLGC